MKNKIKLFLFVVLFTSNLASAQLQQGVFAFGGTSGDEGKAVVQTSDRGYAITGFTTSYAAGLTSVYILKLDSVGSVQWSKSIGGADDEEGYSIIQTKDGGYAVTGITTSYGGGADSGFENVYVIKLNAAGDTTWTRAIGGTNEGGDWGNSIVQTTDGGYAIAGITYSFGAGDGDVYVIKLDSAGSLMWTKTIGGTNYDYGRCIVQTSDGGYAIAGGTFSYGAGFNDAYIIKLDSSGNMKWNKVIGGPGDDYVISMVQTTDGGFAATGITGSYGSGGFDVYVLKLDSAGNLQWTKALGATADSWGYSIVQTKDGGYAVAGISYAFSITGFNDDALMLKLDSAGNLLDVRAAGGGESTSTEAWSIAQTKDGGFAVAGWTSYYGVGAGAANVFFLKLDSAFNSCSDLVKTTGSGSGGIVDSGGVVGTGGIASPAGGLVQSGVRTTDVCTVLSGPPPVADFRASDTSFCANTCINFTDLSTNATSWQWNFSGVADSTSTAENPQYVCYDMAGTFNVTLIESNGGGSTSLTFSNYIHVAPAPPTPVITQHHDTLYSTTDPSYAAYQWYNDSTIITGATDSVLVVSASGNYNLRVTNSGGCTSAAGINVIIGIQNYSNDNIIALYPNPATDQLLIRGNWSFTKGESKLTIFNTLGERIYTEELNGKQETLNCKPFPAGIYFVQVENEGSRWIGRFVKE